MRVLRVIGGVDPAFGGPSVSSVSSCIAAQRAGVTNCVAFPADGGEAPPAAARLRGEGIEVRTFRLARIFPARSRRLGLSPALATWLAREAGRFDVIHAHGAWTFTTLTSLLAGKAHGCATVLSTHETLTDFDIARSGLAARAAKRVLRQLYLRSFDLVVLSSLLELRDSRPGTARARSAVLHHPIDGANGALRPSPAQPGSDGGLRLGFLGRFDPKKNLDVLIRAVASLPPAVTLRVAGDGEPALRASLRRLAAETDAADRIEWLGFLGEAEKPIFFGSIDLLVMPSAYECFGLGAAEALAAGLPVIVSPRTGVAEVVEAYDCGLVVPPTVGELSRALVSLLEQPAHLRELAARAPVAVERELSPAVHGERLRHEYERLVTARSARSRGARRLIRAGAAR